MANRKHKRLVLSDGKDKFEASEASVYLTDFGGEYNHGSVVVSFRRLNPGTSWDSREIKVGWEFQRNLLLRSTDTIARSLYWTDTKEEWSVFYAGVHRFETKLGIDSGLSLCTVDVLASKLAVKAGEAIETFNLRHVEPDCELKRFVEALGKLGIPVQKLYVLRGGGDIPIHELSDGHANSRALRAKENAA
jgi:hypothetical protein